MASLLWPIRRSALVHDCRGDAVLPVERPRLQKLFDSSSHQIAIIIADDEFEVDRRSLVLQELHR